MTISVRQIPILLSHKVCALKCLLYTAKSSLKRILLISTPINNLQACLVFHTLPTLNIVHILKAVNFMAQLFFKNISKSLISFELEQVLCKPLLCFIFPAKYLSENVASKCEQVTIPYPAVQVITILGTHFFLLTQAILEKRVIFYYSCYILILVIFCLFVLCSFYHLTWKSKTLNWYYSNNTVL